MKLGLVSMYVIFLALRFVVNMGFLGAAVSQKSTKLLSSKAVQVIAGVEHAIDFVFLVLLARMAIKSGGKA